MFAALNNTSSKVIVVLALLLVVVIKTTSAGQALIVCQEHCRSSEKVSNLFTVTKPRGGGIDI